MLVDTHCHIHEADYPLDRAEVLTRANQAGVSRLISVGTNEESSKNALEFASKHDGVYATIGVHPHDAKHGWQGTLELGQGSVTSDESLNSKLIAIGEIGLDYYYNYSSRDVQIEAFEAQIDFALRFNLPISFHVRDAFSDFWPILDNFSGIRGVLHSFTDTAANLEQALGRGLYIGLNGISTFTKESWQQQVFSQVPLSNMLIETDAPFLTPVPYRGKVNEPAFAREVANHHARVRGISLDDIATTTSANADALFNLNNAS